MREEGARSAEEAIARLAARQHGVVTVGQLKAVGTERSSVSRRVQTGRLHRIHRGVYAVGHRGLSKQGRWMAAVLACGDGAVLSHRSAAELWQLLPSSPNPIHVTVPGDGGRKLRHGINAHRSSTLLPSHTTRRAGIPVTKPARTLEDLRQTLSPEQFAAALREAEFLRLPVGEQFDPDGTRSELETRFLALCRRYRLPTPEVNVRVGPFLVDFLWPRCRLIVEVDGHRTHGTRSAFEADRARDAQLKVAGYDVVRLTWRQVDEDSARIADTIRTLIQGKRGQPGASTRG